VYSLFIFRVSAIQTRLVLLFLYAHRCYVRVVLFNQTV